MKKSAALFPVASERLLLVFEGAAKEKKRSWRRRLGVLLLGTLATTDWRSKVVMKRVSLASCIAAS